MFTLHLKILKMQQSLAILDLCLKKPQAGKSYGYCDIIVFKKPTCENVLRPQ